MADIHIYIGSLAAAADEQLQVNGDAVVEGYSGSLQWQAEYARTATPATAKAAIRAAAVAAAAAVDITVGVADQKILYASPEGLV